MADELAVRWARDSEGRLHVVEPADALVAVARGYTEVLCGQVHLAADVELEPGPSGALCLACVIGVTDGMEDPGRLGSSGFSI